MDSTTTADAPEATLARETLARDIVLYDGECNFCKGQIANLRRLDGKNRLEFVSLHDPRVRREYPDLTHEQLMEQMWIITPSGQRFGGADAVRYLTTRLPILWPLWPVMHLPGTMPVWRFAYRKIAERRYRIAGKSCDNGSCELHHPPKKSSARS